MQTHRGKIGRDADGIGDHQKSGQNGQHEIWERLLDVSYDPGAGDATNVCRNQLIGTITSHVKTTDRSMLKPNCSRHLQRIAWDAGGASASLASTCAPAILARDPWSTSPGSP